MFSHSTNNHHEDGAVSREDERLAFTDARVQAEKEAKRRRMISKGQEMVRAITNVWVDAKYPGMREVRPDELCRVFTQGYEVHKELRAKIVRMSREELADFVEKLDIVREETPYSYSAAIREIHAHDKPPYDSVDPRVTVSPPANCNGPNYMEHDPKVKASPKKKGSRR